MQSLYLVAIAVLALGMLYAIGGFLGDVDTQCVSIGGCKGCWKTVTATVTSELCPGSTPAKNETCAAEPYLMQNNAIVDALTCACNQADDDGAYPDAAHNKQIEDVYATFTKSAAKVQDICGLSSPLVRRAYG
ncbi:MAG: hypothetical protein HYY37_00260 [Candidatus Aenigmarchaeota archaeon]|nr:hypothetical protein [Candidatus Aenigmarchaeota archaeon]